MSTKQSSDLKQMEKAYIKYCQTIIKCGYIDVALVHWKVKKRLDSRSNSKSPIAAQYYKVFNLQASLESIPFIYSHQFESKNENSPKKLIKEKNRQSQGTALPCTQAKVAHSAY